MRRSEFDQAKRETGGLLVYVLTGPCDLSQLFAKKSARAASAKSDGNFSAEKLLLWPKLRFSILGRTIAITPHDLLTMAASTAKQRPPEVVEASEDGPSGTEPEKAAEPEASSSGAQDINPTGNKNRPAIIGNKSLTLPAEQSFPPINEDVMKECEECHQDFLRSYLYRTFGVTVCDDCREPKGTHELITRTDAKTKYLLKDCDLDLRKPTLRYILKKNPYQSRGDMRLYLKYQIEERALEVHGSEEKLEEELDKREERRSVKRQKTHDKKMKSLSMQVRSSLYKKSVASHEHEYGEPVCINEDEDIFRRICKTCGHKWEYEEM